MMDSFRAALMSGPVRQLIRYGLVGVASNLALYGFYLLITHFGVEPKRAMTIAYVVGALIGFAGHRQWTFAHEGAVLSSGAKYVIAHLLGYTINFLILLVFVDRLGYSHQWVQATAIIVIAGFLFVTFRYFVFSKNESGCGSNK